MSIDNQPQIGGFPARTASSSVPSRPAVATLPPPDPRAAVSIRGLYKRFDRKIAVNGLSLDIPVGSFFGLVGPNGAGKTTTLNMVTGLLVPDAYRDDPRAGRVARTSTPPNVRSASCRSPTRYSTGSPECSC